MTYIFYCTFLKGKQNDIKIGPQGRPWGKFSKRKVHNIDCTESCCIFNGQFCSLSGSDHIFNMWSYKIIGFREANCFSSWLFSFSQTSEALWRCRHVSPSPPRALYPLAGTRTVCHTSGPSLRWWQWWRRKGTTYPTWPQKELLEPWLKKVYKKKTREKGKMRLGVMSTCKNQTTKEHNT